MDTLGDALAAAARAGATGAAVWGLCVGLRRAGVTSLDTHVVPAWQAAVLAAVCGALAREIAVRSREGEDDDDGDWVDVESSDDEDDEDDDEDEYLRMDPKQKKVMQSAAKAMLEHYPDSDCKLVVLVRQDLKMQKGKIAAQTGHAVLGCYRAAKACQPELVRRWLHRGQAKVALKVDNETELDEIQRAARENGLTAVAIRDAGRTQVDPGTRTVLGIGPAPKGVIDIFTGHLKLL